MLNIKRGSTHGVYKIRSVKLVTISISGIDEKSKFLKVRGMSYRAGES